MYPEKTNQLLNGFVQAAFQGKGIFLLRLIMVEPRCVLLRAIIKTRPCWSTFERAMTCTEIWLKNVSNLKTMKSPKKQGMLPRMDSSLPVFMALTIFHWLKGFGKRSDWKSSRQQTEFRLRNI